MSSQADNGTETEPIEVRRMRVLRPYIEARAGELRDKAGRPIKKPLRPDLGRLEVELEASQSWISRQVAFIADEIGWQNVVANNFKFEERTGGRGKSRRTDAIDSEIRRAIAYACEDCGLEPGTSTALDRAMQWLRDRDIFKDDLVKRPKRHSVAKVMSSDFGALAHAGANHREHLSRVAEPSERPDALMNYVLLDWTGFSQDHRKLIVLTDDDFVIGRVSLISAVEVATRIPWAWLWCASVPNSELIGYCISNGLLSKAPLLAKYGIPGRYPIEGKPLILRHDNGSDLVSKHTKTAISEAGIRFNERIPVRTPTFAGKQERFHGTAKSLFLNFLEELKLRPKSEQRYPRSIRTDLKRGNIYLRWSELERTWIEWLLTKYLPRPHKGSDMDGITPLRRYEELVSGVGYHMTGLRKSIEDSLELQWVFLRRTELRRFDGALEIDKRKYYCDALSRIFPGPRGLLKSPIEVRWNPYRLREIYVRDPATLEIVVVPLIEPHDLADCSESEWKRAIVDLKRVYVLKPTLVEIADLVGKRKAEIACGSKAPGPRTLNRSDYGDDMMQSLYRDRFSAFLFKGGRAAASTPEGKGELLAGAALKEGEIPKPFDSVRPSLGAGVPAEYLRTDRIVRF